MGRETSKSTGPGCTRETVAARAALAAIFGAARSVEIFWS